MTTPPREKRHPYDQWSPDARALDLVGDKWTLLIARDLLAGPRRFIELQRVLPGISTEQLRSRLARMVADGLLTRRRYREVPPRVDYELTERGHALAPVIAALARWGETWAWSAPREGEAIDVGAVFRSRLGLFDPRGIRGTVEMRVDEREYCLEFDGSTAVLKENAAEAADAVIAGTREAWIEVLSPDHRKGALEYSGEPNLVDFVLDGLGVVTPKPRRLEAVA